MRLDVLETGHRRHISVALRAMRALGRAEPDDVVKTSLYRPELFGRPWIALLRETMRGPSPWTAGERELLGAFTSRLNECPYCAAVHTGVAELELGVAVDTASLERWRDGGLGPRLTAAFSLLEDRDVEAARQAGLTDVEIVDALHVQFVFNVVNRLANALGYSWANEADKTAGIRVLHRLGYRLPGVLLR